MFKKLLHTKIHIYILLTLQLVLAYTTLNAYVDPSLKLYSIVALLFVLFIPWIVNIKKGIRPFFRFVTIFLAFIPSFNPSILNTILASDNPFFLTVSSDHQIIMLTLFNKEILPILVLLMTIYLKSGFKIKKWQFSFLAISLLSICGMLFFSVLSDIFLYMATYLLIVLVFYYSEKIFSVCTKTYEKFAMWLFIAVLYLRGIYVLLSILEVYLFA